MIQVVCNICKRILPDNPQVHYCERCMPFAPQFEAEVAGINGECLALMKKKTEQMRNRYLQEVVIPQTKAQLKAV